MSNAYIPNSSIHHGQRSSGLIKGVRFGVCMEEVRMLFLLSHICLLPKMVSGMTYGIITVVAARMECAAPYGLVIEGFKLPRQVSGILVYLLALL